jgi:catechol 2,3-dioxygenase-like lactoylglutathione lyase family enzyme
MSKLLNGFIGLGFAAIGTGLGAPAFADGLPGMRGHDHTGITVPDMDQAVTFFVDVLGCKKAMSFGPFSDNKGNFMKDALDVNPRAVITQITLVRCGYGSNIELFSYTSPDQQVVQPKNSDVGGYHIAFYVDDIKAADQIPALERRLDLVRPCACHPGTSRGSDDRLFQGALGPANGGDFLPRRDGLREDLRHHSLEPEGSREVGIERGRGSPVTASCGVEPRRIDRFLYSAAKCP